MNNAISTFQESSVMRLNESHKRIIKCMDLLSNEQLLYRPNLVSNSVANIIIHTLGNMTQYILSSLGQNADHRDRDSEFVPRDSIDPLELRNKVNHTFSAVIHTINHCNDTEMMRKRLVQGFDFDGIGIILHVVEHASYHVGQITYLTKMLTGSETSYYGGVNLNIRNEE